MSLEGLFDISSTNFTKTVHQSVYPAISSTRPELSQAGRTILITGGGESLGYHIAQAFVRAGASTIIIIGRRPEILAAGKARLQKAVEAAGTTTQILTFPCDVTDRAQVDALWREIANVRGLVVDVFVSNAAKHSQPLPLLEAGVDDVFSQVDVNVKGPMYIAEKLYAQPDKRQKFIVNVSSGSIHYFTHPAILTRAGGTFTKMAGTMLFQLVAMETPHEKLQVVSYHPGLLYNDYFRALGLTSGRFDSSELGGAFAVWASTKEAAFLHGRFVWASWDVDELAGGEIRQEIEADPYFLRAGVPPLTGGNRGYRDL